MLPNANEFFLVIYNVYANEAGNHVIRSEMLAQLQSTEESYNLAAVNILFKTVSINIICINISTNVYFFSLIE